MTDDELKAIMRADADPHFQKINPDKLVPVDIGLYRKFRAGRLLTEELDRVSHAYIAEHPEFSGVGGRNDVRASFYAYLRNELWRRELKTSRQEKK